MRPVLSALVAALLLAGCGGAASTTAPSTPSATARPLPDGALAAGTYSILDGHGTFDVPAGWEGCCNAFGAIKSEIVALLFEDITNGVVYADSCKWKAGPNPEPKGAQATAAALAAQVGRGGTVPEASTVAGRPGWRVKLTVPADQAVTTVGADNAFTGCDDGRFATWGLKGDSQPSRYQQRPSQIDTLFVVDVGDRTIVIDMVSSPDIAASDQAELDAMLASLQLT